MITVHYSTILNHPVESAWLLVRDFNNYPVYIEGVTESVIEDDRSGDEVGAVRRFCYAGHWIRQRLVAHSDAQHAFTYVGLEPLPFPQGRVADAPAPALYEGTLRLQEIVDGARTFVEWSVTMDSDAEPWRDLLRSWIPEWTGSLRRTLDHRGGEA